MVRWARPSFRLGSHLLLTDAITGPGHTGRVPQRNTISARWLTVILGVAMLCSAAVVYGLIQITGGSTPASAPGSAGASASASEHPESTNPATTTSARPDASSGAGGPAGSGIRSTETAVGTTTSAPMLPGSLVQLPAAWTGKADVTVTVLGRCAATGGTSSYSLTADLALQRPVVGSAGPVNAGAAGTGIVPGSGTEPGSETGTETGSAPGIEFGDANPLSMTLGISPAGIPGLTVYSASVDGAGAVHRSWWLSTGIGPGGSTLISGVLIADQPIDGALPPNLLSDGETDLQPCEAGRTVGVPRALAAGSRITGWVSATRAELDLSGRTTDGERAVTARVVATRLP